MSQTDAGWGAGPSARYEALAARRRPALPEIRAAAMARDGARRLPQAEIGGLEAAGFATLRLAEALQRAFEARRGDADAIAPPRAYRVGSA